MVHISFWLMPYDVNILGESIHTVKENAEALIAARRDFGLEVNADKTKYMVIFRDQNAGRIHSVRIDNSTFERVEEFKYLGTNLLTYLLHGASPIQSIYAHPTSWRSVLILSAHQRLGLPSGSFPPVSPPRPYTPSSPHPYVPHAQLTSFFSILSPAQYWVRSTSHLAPRYAVSSIPPLSPPF